MDLNKIILICNSHAEGLTQQLSFKFGNETNLKDMVKPGAVWEQIIWCSKLW